MSIEFTGSPDTGWEKDAFSQILDLWKKAQESQNKEDMEKYLLRLDVYFTSISISTLFIGDNDSSDTAEAVVNLIAKILDGKPGEVTIQKITDSWLSPERVQLFFNDNVSLIQRVSRQEALDCMNRVHGREPRH